MAVAQHAVSQQAFSLRVARGLHLPSDLGHRVQHVEFGSRSCAGKVLALEVLEFHDLIFLGVKPVILVLPGLGWRYSWVLDKRSNTDLLVTSTFCFGTEMTEIHLISVLNL